MGKKKSSTLGSVDLLVTPEQMYSAADLIEKKISNARNAFDGMLDDVRATAAYWEGDAGDKERQRFAQEKGNFDALIKNLINYAAELKIITGFYEANEQAAVMTADALPANILS